ncbi:MAG TPA: ATP-binding protein [Burkholderiales bacterium]|nr:ATP-binding protein [Burkholderiales bacterium]
MGARPAPDVGELQRRLAAAFAGTLAVVLVLALALLDTASRALEASSRAARAQEVLQVIGSVEGALVTAQSAVRGFLITGQSVYLRDRDRALAALESRVRRLRDIAIDDDAQRERWGALRERLDERLALFGRLVAIRQTRGPAAARDFLASIYPPAKKGVVHALTAGMAQEQQRRLAAQLRDGERAGNFAIAAGLSLAVVFGMVFTLGYLAVRRQVAEVARLNASLAIRTEEAEAANRELESFSYSVSHDLRSPLRAIDGFSRILVEDYGARLDDEGRRLLGVVLEGSRKMERLIDDLLDFSRLGKKPLALAAIDMTALAREVYGELRGMRAARTEGEPVFALAPLPQGRGDAAILRHVFVNLLSNALKYARKDRVPRIEVSGWDAGSETVYRVKDEGVGFDMAYYDKLFGLFQRLHSDKDFSGTGVGLAIVKRVVERHGGRVWAESRPGAGASFYFSLPKAATIPSTDPYRKEVAK